MFGDCLGRGNSQHRESLLYRSYFNSAIVPPTIFSRREGATNGNCPWVVVEYSILLQSPTFHSSITHKISPGRFRFKPSAWRSHNAPRKQTGSEEAMMVPPILEPSPKCPPNFIDKSERNADVNFFVKRLNISIRLNQRFLKVLSRMTYSRTCFISTLIQSCPMHTKNLYLGISCRPIWCVTKRGKF